MGIELPIFAVPASGALPLSYPFNIRARRILDMKASLVEMFGDAAVAIARSQPSHHDVGRESGVNWQDLVEAFQSV